MQETNIVWKRLIYQGNDYGDYYLVSNTGEIKGVKSGKIRSKNVNKKGYCFVSGSLGSRSSKITFKVHKAVAETFIPLVDGKNLVNHKDGNKLNNHVDNLEWCTNQENIIHAIKNNLKTYDFRKKAVRNVTTGKIYKSITEAAKKYDSENYTKALSKISNALCGYTNTAYDCKWEYI